MASGQCRRKIFAMSTSSEPTPRGAAKPVRRTAKAPPLGLRQASDLIGSIYQGMVENVPWSGFLWQLRGLLGSNWVTLILRPPSGSIPARIINAGPTGVTIAEGQWTSFNVFAIDPMI